jgi:hypothetical protein
MTSKRLTYGTVDRSYGMRLATTPPDRDGPIWMVGPFVARGRLTPERQEAEEDDGDGKSGCFRHAHGKGRAPSLGALEVELEVVRLRQLRHDRQPDPYAVRAGREERLKDLVVFFHRDPRTLIDHAHHDLIIGSG